MDNGNLKGNECSLPLREVGYLVEYFWGIEVVKLREIVIWSYSRLFVQGIEIL